MTTAAIPFDLVGFQPIGNSSTFVEVADNNTSYKPIVAVGTVVDFVDPYYGSGRAIRLCIPANTTAIKPGTLTTWAAATNAGFLSNYSFVICPSTANLSKPVAIAINQIPLNASVPQYAWFAIAGTLPVISTVAVATTDKIWISATAGFAFVSITAGKQIVGANPVVATTGTVVKTASTANGSATLKTQNSDGWFVGQALTGTGIPASTTIGAIDITGTVISMVQTGTTTAQLATATGSVSVTATNNDATNFWAICQFNAPFAQGNAT